jgi:hypothetical protein
VDNLNEKIEKVLNTFSNKVLEKMNKENFETDMVHEDIKIMYHIIKIRNELKEG